MALNKVLEIKGEYIRRFGEDSLYEYSTGTCLDHWVGMLGSQEYEDILSDLHRNECDGLILLHYRLPHLIQGQDFFKANDGLMAECRSVVIDFRRGELALVPFRKFRNLGECDDTSEERIRSMLEHANVVEFSDKLDGSMQSARFYNGRLVMSGSRAIDRSKSFRLENGYRFIESHSNYMRMVKENSNLSFIFEYIFEDDVHVVDYSGREQGLYLIGARDVDDGRELHYHEVFEIAHRYDVMTTAIMDLDLDGALLMLEDTSGDQREGLVLNIDGFRVKMKARDYVCLNNCMWDIQNDDVLFNMVRSDTLDDVIGRMPRTVRDEALRKRDIIVGYAKKRQGCVEAYLESLAQTGISEKKGAMIWISDNVPSDYAALVRSVYLGMEVDYLKGINASMILGERR